jgi:hypothetical protein
MIRWLRLTAAGALVLAIIGLGVGIGLFLVANASWVAVRVPPWLTGVFGDRALDVWLPGLIAGWLVAVLATATLLLWSMYYVWRRRQYESLIARLERELIKLRNLPFTDPAPLEDLPETPDPHAARILADVDRGRGASRAIARLEAAKSDDDGDDGDDDDGSGGDDGAVAVTSGAR